MAGLTQTTSTRSKLATGLMVVLGSVAGFVLAIIAILNLHILVGLEQGYASTPAEVAEFSVVLVVVDVIILIVGPVLGALAMRWMSRSTARSDSPSPPSLL